MNDPTWFDVVDRFVTPLLGQKVTVIHRTSGLSLTTGEIVALGHDESGPWVQLPAPGRMDGSERSDRLYIGEGDPWRLET